MKDFKFLFLIIGFLCFSGCKTENPSNTFVAEWTMPTPPKNLPVNFIPQDDGLYMDFISSSNLLFNIDELDRYIESLEVLIKTMQAYYNVH